METESAHRRGGAVVVVPTYDEALNIEDLVSSLLAFDGDLHVLVVDDNSPDGTAALVRSMEAFGRRVFLLARPSKAGLGSAYRAGFAWAADRGYARMVQMDADLSHPVERLAAVLAGLEDADLVIGSRYVDGGELADWSLGRRVISWLANAYVRVVLRLPVADSTAGFRAFRADLLRTIDVLSSTSNGYCFQIETAWRAHRCGATIREVPIRFTDRRRGASKMSLRIAFEAVVQVARWRVGELVPRPRRRIGPAVPSRA